MTDPGPKQHRRDYRLEQKPVYRPSGYAIFASIGVAYLLYHVVKAIL